MIGVSWRLRAVGVGMVLMVATIAGTAITAAPAGAVVVTLYVAPTGSGGASCATPDYNTISAAVTGAISGDSIDVCTGTYNESVDVNNKQLTINAVCTATIDASGHAEGVVIQAGGAAGSVLGGFTIENAQGEGVLVEGTTNVTVMNNVVSGNDVACLPQTGQNDCGEGIHLESVTNSTVSRNTSENNTGGILLDDGVPPGSIGVQAFGGPTAYYGPTSGNLIQSNIVVNNVWDCGITMPSHNSNAAPGGSPNPSAGGVFNNTVTGNVSQNNGIQGGGGSGILMAAPFPGTAAYDNTIEGNTVSGNGQAGITVHSHAPAQDVNGNQILNNTVGQNAVGETSPGSGVFTSGSTSAGDVDAGDPATTGILVYSAVGHVTGTAIQGNSISNNYYGIWTQNVDTSGTSSNTFTNVNVPTYAVPAPGSGYLLAGADGGVFTFGALPFWGSAVGSLSAGSSVVGMTETPDAGGYWIASSTGGVASFGDAANLGSMSGARLNAPVVGIAPTPTGHGFLLVASDGGVFSFGDASFHGSMGGRHLNKPIVGMAPTPDGNGYWLVASDGGVFNFGSAVFSGSAGSIHLNKPVVGMAPTPDGNGYWLVASDGGAFPFGTAVFSGSAGSIHLNKPVVGMAPTPDGKGYWLVASDGGVFNFGSASYFGSTGGKKLNAPVVALAT